MAGRAGTRRGLPRALSPRRLRRTGDPDRGAGAAIGCSGRRLRARAPNVSITSADGVRPRAVAPGSLGPHSTSSGDRALAAAAVSARSRSGRDREHGGRDPRPAVVKICLPTARASRARVRPALEEHGGSGRGTRAMPCAAVRRDSRPCSSCGLPGAGAGVAQEPLFIRIRPTAGWPTAARAAREALWARRQAHARAVIESVCTGCLGAWKPEPPAAAAATRRPAEVGSRTSRVRIGLEPDPGSGASDQRPDPSIPERHP